MYTFKILIILGIDMKTKFRFCVMVFISLCVLTIPTSCTSVQKEVKINNNLGDYESITYEIDSKITTKPIDENYYKIDSIHSLIVPDNLSTFEATKFYVSDEKIYILDNEAEKTILVFDFSGKYLYKLGEIGRAKNEYINTPRDFFIAKNGEVHVFDYTGKKMLIFDNNGNFISSFDSQSANSFGMTSSGKYICCINDMETPEQEPEPSLITWNFKSGKKKTLIPYKGFQCYYQHNFRTFFFNDGRLSHIPLVSDSVIVFKDDEVEKVVRFDFKCGYLPNDEPEAVRWAADDSQRSKFRKCIMEYHGVFAMFDYQETESLILMNYVYESRMRSWLYDKRIKNIIHGDKIFPGYRASYNYFLKGNQIIVYVGKENVEALKEDCESKDFNKDEFDESPSQVKDLLSGKIKAPALFYITIK